MQSQFAPEMSLGVIKARTRRMTDRVWMAAEIVGMIEVVEPFPAQSYLKALYSA
jgi:hypothetical protein